MTNAKSAERYARASKDNLYVERDTTEWNKPVPLFRLVRHYVKKLRFIAVCAIRSFRYNISEIGTTLRLLVTVRFFLCYVRAVFLLFTLLIRSACFVTSKLNTITISNYSQQDFSLACPIFKNKNLFVQSGKKILDSQNCIYKLFLYVMPNNWPRYVSLPLILSPSISLLLPRFAVRGKNISFGHALLFAFVSLEFIREQR